MAGVKQGPDERQRPSPRSGAKRHRVVLGLHYPSDVLAATAIGSAIASLSLWAVPGATLF